MRFVLLCVVLLAAGCSQAPLHELKVDAKSSLAFQMWRVDVSDRLSKEQWTLFDGAVQELKFKIMSEGEVQGSAAIDQTFRERIDGENLYAVIQQGLQLRLNRLLSEKAELEKYAIMNARLRTRDGDEESAVVLKGIRDSQRIRIETLTEQVEEAKADMVLLEKTFHPDA